MPRDYKHRARKRKKRNTLSPLAGVIGGLLIGLFVAFLVYLKMQGKPDPHDTCNKVSRHRPPLSNRMYARSSRI